MDRRWSRGEARGSLWWFRRSSSGRLKRRDPVGAEVYEETWLGTVLGDDADRILPIDAETAEEWGRISVPVPGC